MKRKKKAIIKEYNKKYKWTGTLIIMILAITIATLNYTTKGNMKLSILRSNNCFKDNGLLQDNETCRVLMNIPSSKF